MGIYSTAKNIRIKISNTLQFIHTWCMSVIPENALYGVHIRETYQSIYRAFICRHEWHRVGETTYICTLCNAKQNTKHYHNGI